MCVRWAGRRRTRHPPARGVAAVVVPVALLGTCAALVSLVAAHVGARGGQAPRAWLGDAALVLDVLGALGVLGVPAALRVERERRAGTREVDQMTGGEFEARLAALFSALGYAVTRTKASGDFGADLVLEASGERVVVQAKRHERAVGIEAVQQVIGATRYYDAGRAVVVTNSTCTPAAAALAASHGVELVERDRLLRLLAAHPLEASGLRAPWALVSAIGSGAALTVLVAAAVLRWVWELGRTAMGAPARRGRHARFGQRRRV